MEASRGLVTCQGHRAGQWHSPGLNPRNLAPDPTFHHYNPQIKPAVITVNSSHLASAFYRPGSCLALDLYSLISFSQHPVGAGQPGILVYRRRNGGTAMLHPELHTAEPRSVWAQSRGLTIHPPSSLVPLEAHMAEERTEISSMTTEFIFQTGIPRKWKESLLVISPGQEV